MKNYKNLKEYNEAYEKHEKEFQDYMNSLSMDEYLDQKFEFWKEITYMLIVSNIQRFIKLFKK